jgi:hypothetical protein
MYTRGYVYKHSRAFLIQRVIERMKLLTWRGLQDKGGVSPKGECPDHVEAAVLRAVKLAANILTLDPRSSLQQVPPVKPTSIPFIILVGSGLSLLLSSQSQLLVR